MLIDPFTDPDDFGNIIGQPGGVPMIPAEFRITPLGPQPLAGGDWGLVTIFPISVTFDPVTGGTLDAVLSVLNESAGPLFGWIAIGVPTVSNQGL